MNNKWPVDYAVKSMEKHKISGSVKLHIGDSWGKPERHKCPQINVLSVATHKCWNWT